MHESNVFMPGPEKFNLALPVPLKREFDAIAEEYGERQKGPALSAALLLLLELPKEGRDYLVEELAVAKVRGNYDTLMARARSGELRREAENKVAESERLRKPPRSGGTPPRSGGSK